MNMQVFIKKTLVATAVMAALSGCSAMHTNYERPELAQYVYAHGRNNVSTVTTLADADKSTNTNMEAEPKLEADFWVQFGDEHLSSIIEEVLASGGDYRSALITAERALKEADITATNLIPDVAGELGGDISKSFSGGHSKRSSSSSLKVSYEADLFGRLSAERKEQALEAKASVNDAATARLSIASEVASLYWKVIYYRDAIRLDEASLKDAERTFEIMNTRYETGKVSRLELLQSERDLVEQRSALETDNSSLKKSISALNAMRNAVPDAEIITADSLIGLKAPTVSLTRGSELLSARPDMRAAEDRLRSALAGKDVAKLKMYPKLTLSAGISAGSSSELYEFFKDPLGKLAATLAFPFLNYYQNSLNIDLASLDHESAEVKFVSAYYLALAEVSEAQSDLELNEIILANDKKRYELSTGTESIYLARYEAGNVALKDYLEAKTTRRNAEKSVLTDIRTTLDDTVVLVKALGGI